MLLLLLVLQPAPGDKNILIFITFHFQTFYLILSHYYFCMASYYKIYGERIFNVLLRWLLTFYCNGPDGDYFRICKTQGVCSDYSALLLYQKSSHKFVTEWAWLGSNKTVWWTLEFEFYIISRSQNIFVLRPNKIR